MCAVSRQTASAVNAIRNACSGPYPPLFVYCFSAIIANHSHCYYGFHAFLPCIKEHGILGLLILTKIMLETRVAVHQASVFRPRTTTKGLLSACAAATDDPPIRNVCRNNATYRVQLGHDVLLFVYKCLNILFA